VCLRCSSGSRLWQTTRVAASTVRLLVIAPDNPVEAHCRIAIDSKPSTQLETNWGFARMPRISTDEVAHLARLARLAVTEEELTTFAGQLDVILNSVARVGELATDDTPPTSHAVELTNVFRPDEVRSGLSRDEALAAAPASEQDRFRVPRILGEEQ
jgi:aspartyl-tRNA(Asn)/glutamyl-tRNA(Gln) amidotransferase subunit C